MQMITYRGVRYREEDLPQKAKRSAPEPDEKQAPKPANKERTPANKEAK